MCLWVNYLIYVICQPRLQDGPIKVLLREIVQPAHDPGCRYSSSEALLNDGQWDDLCELVMPSVVMALGGKALEALP